MVIQYLSILKSESHHCPLVIHTEQFISGQPPGLVFFGINLSVTMDDLNECTLSVVQFIFHSSMVIEDLT